MESPPHALRISRTLLAERSLLLKRGGASFADSVGGLSTCSCAPSERSALFMPVFPDGSDICISGSSLMDANTAGMRSPAAS